MNTRKLTVVSFLAAAVFALGCAADDGGLTELDDNRALWESHGITDYEMEVDGIDGVPTVTSLFNNIEQAIETGVVVEVEYDLFFGFPTRVESVEPAEGLLDFEVTFITFGELDRNQDGTIDPPPVPPAQPPRLPGFPDFIDDRILDAPSAEIIVSDGEILSNGALVLVAD